MRRLVVVGVVEAAVDMELSIEGGQGSDRRATHHTCDASRSRLMASELNWAFGVPLELQPALHGLTVVSQELSLAVRAHALHRLSIQTRIHVSPHLCMRHVGSKGAGTQWARPLCLVWRRGASTAAALCGT